MGLLKNLYGVFNTKVLCEQIVEHAERMYEMARRANPGAAQHELLAYVWRMRMKTWAAIEGFPTPPEHVNNPNSVRQTALMAILPYPDSIKALGLSFIAFERPDLMKKHPSFLGEYRRLIKPAVIALEDGSYPKVYLTRNSTSPREDMCTGSALADTVGYKAARGAWFAGIGLEEFDGMNTGRQQR